MKRKYIPAVIVSLILVIALVTASLVYANDVTWRYDSDTKTLYISGSGIMDDYENSYSTPWNKHISTVENLVVADGVTSVGSYILAGAENLTNVTLADSVVTIGEYAFASCPSLTELELSEYVTTIADYSFAFNGIAAKSFTAKVPVGSYALFCIIKNNSTSSNVINYDIDDVKCGHYSVSIRRGGMFAYYPYVPKHSGTYKFYSTGTHDTRGYVYDSSFDRIYYNDDYNGSSNFGLYSINLTAGETYYFAAKIMNSSLKGSFDVYLEPVEYTISGSILAMNDPSGEASNVLINEAVLDGVATNGVYSRTVTEDNNTAVIEAGNKTINFTFSPDNEDDIVINMCDMNNDGYVNGRDYAAMKTTNSKYKPLFANFIGYEAK